MTADSTRAAERLLHALEAVEARQLVHADLPQALLQTEACTAGLSEAGHWLLKTLRAQVELQRLAQEGEQLTDDLRRYQRFAKPGAPSAQVIQLRRRQAALRQAGNVARQSYLKGAAQFVHRLGLPLSGKVTADSATAAWVQAHAPAR